ncbi:MAG: LysE/ArgO family amino acid transporter [Rhodobacteraceae bacterium]|nr:LysE/ArgO family amino acid transporter [Paracoccaceae bacterium]
MLLVYSFVSGFALGFGLILAIGAQNAFVLRQGLRQSHVFWVCFVCALSDMVLIAAGVAGIGAFSEAAPWFEPLMRYGGAAFLIWYGFVSLNRAWRGGDALRASEGAQPGLAATVATALALTWLNPHVYIDTVLLIGSIAAQYDSRIGFGAGACLASFVFFFSLGYGARLLAPLLARPRAWQVLELIIAATLWIIAARLLLA